MKLNLTQKRVLGGLNAYPQYNDRQLAEVLGMKRSTVTLARHFLQRQKLYRVELLPNYKYLDLALLGIKYGDYGKVRPIDYQHRIRMITPEVKISECVWSLSCGFRAFSLYFVRDFHPIMEQFHAWDALFKGVDYSITLKDKLFSPLAVKSFKLLDTQDYLATILGVSSLPPQKPSDKPHPLRKNEKKVLQHMVRGPNASNAEISLKTGLSRSLVGRIRQKMEDRGVVQFIHLPAWPALGVHLAIFFHLRPSSENRDFITSLHQSPNVIFLLASSHHILFLTLFRDYEEYQSSSLAKTIKEQKDLITEPVELMFPLKETIFQIDSSPALRKFFS